MGTFCTYRPSYRSEIMTGFNWLLSLKHMLLNCIKRHQLGVCFAQSDWPHCEHPDLRYYQICTLLFFFIFIFSSFHLLKRAKLAKNSCLQVMKLYLLWSLLVLFAKSHLRSPFCLFFSVSLCGACGPDTTVALN